MGISALEASTKALNLCEHTVSKAATNSIVCVLDDFFGIEIGAGGFQCPTGTRKSPVSEWVSDHTISMQPLTTLHVF